MNILQVVGLGYEAGGAEKNVKLIRDAMRARGHRVLVLSTDKGVTGKSTYADAMVPSVKGNAITRLLHFFWHPQSYSKMRAIIHDFSPDIIHFHTISEFSPALIWAVKDVPMMLTVHGPEEFTLDLLPWLLPASDYKNGSYDWQDLRTRGKLRYAYYRWLQRPGWLLQLRRLRAIVAPSKFMAQVIKDDLDSVPVLQIYNGVNLSKPVPLAPQLGQIILYVGRLEPIKGADCLIRAFSRVHQNIPETKLRIVGDGSQHHALERLARNLGLADCVEFPGWKEAGELTDEYADARVVVIPSMCPETLGQVAIEALAMGRPVICSNTGGLVELVDRPSYGRTVTPRVETDLVEAMQDILLHPVSHEQIAQHFSTRRNDFDETTFVDRLLRVYENVIFTGSPNRQTCSEPVRVSARPTGSSTAADRTGAGRAAWRG